MAKSAAKPKLCIENQAGSLRREEGYVRHQDIRQREAEEMMPSCLEERGVFQQRSIIRVTKKCHTLLQWISMHKCDSIYLK